MTHTHTKKIAAISFLVGLLSFSSVAFAQDWQPLGQVDGSIDSMNLQAFKSYKDMAKVPDVTIKVPTILEADFGASEVYSSSFGVYNETTKRFIPYRFIYSDQKAPVVSNSSDVVSGVDTKILFDSNYSTMSDFRINEQDRGIATIKVTFATAIKSNSLTLVLDNYVSLPSTVTIKTVSKSGDEVIVLNKFAPTSPRINFPDTTSVSWVVEMTYAQPLRISEIQFNNLLNVVTKKSVRFLALPENSYTIYTNQENPVRNYADSEEAPDLNSSEGVKKVGTLTISSNPAFVLSDVDKDGLPDIRDNCVAVSNPDQADVDGNGRGDVCDDFDHDQVINSKDNCPNVANVNQTDTDGDGMGDMCDTDESRVTEKYPIIVWFGIGFASVVFVGLLLYVGNKMRENSNQI